LVADDDGSGGHAWSVVDGSGAPGVVHGNEWSDVRDQSLGVDELQRRSATLSGPLAAKLCVSRNTHGMPNRPAASRSARAFAGFSMPSATSRVRSLTPAALVLPRLRAMRARRRGPDARGRWCA